MSAVVDKLHSNSELKIGNALNFLENVYDGLNLWVMAKHDPKEGLLLVREIIYSQILRLKLNNEFVHLGEIHEKRDKKLSHALEIDMRRARLPTQLVTRGAAKKDKNSRSICEIL